MIIRNAAAMAVNDVIIGAVYIAKGVTKLADWVTSMRGEGYDLPDDQMEQLFKESKAFDAGEELPAAETPLIQTNISVAASMEVNNVIIGATYIAEGVTKFADWVTSMRSSDVNLSDEEMEQLFTESKAFHDEEELPSAEDAPLIQTSSSDSDMNIRNAAADAADYVLLGAVKIAKGITKFGDWMVSMRGSGIELSDAEMEQLFNESKAFDAGEDLPAADTPLIQTNISNSDMIIRNAAADAADTVFIGALKIAKGITKFADWAISMKESDPEIPDDQMEQLFKESQAMHDGEELPAAETPLKARKAKAPAIDRVKAIAADGEELDSRTVYELVVEKMKAHAMASPNPAKAEMTDADFNSIRKEVTTEVKAYFPDITEDEIRGLFSGYGKILKPSQDELSEQVRQLSALLKLALDIMDAQTKIAHLKPGPQRDRATQVVQRQRKKLAREYRMSGLEHATGSPGS